MRRFRTVPGLLVMFIILALIIPITQVSAGPTSVSSGIDKAKQVGLEYISNNYETYPEWSGASLKDGQTFYNLENQVVAYLFAIYKQNLALGRIVVGSELYNFAVFEAGSAPMPSIPNLEDLGAIFTRDIGIEINITTINKPKLVYTGYDSYFAVYDLDGKSISLDLRSKTAVPTSHLRMFIASPAQFQNDQQNISPLFPGEMLILPVPLRGQWDPQVPSDKQPYGCGPTSGAMIGEYYCNYRYYWSFLYWPYDFSRLYTTMGTGSLGTMPWAWGPGFSSYAAQCGYNFGNDYNGISPAFNVYYWDQLRAYIQACQPIGVLFPNTCPYTYSWHYCTVKGYQIDYSNYRYMVINNPGSNYGYEDTVSYDLYYSYISLHWIWPQ